MYELNLIYHKIVPMQPFGKERPRVPQDGRPAYMPPKYQARRDELMWYCYDRPDMEGKLLELTVYGRRPMPKSWSKAKRLQMAGLFTTTKPDLDNLAGAVMDALLIEDSNVVLFGPSSKTWSEEAAIEIIIKEIRQNDR